MNIVKKETPEGVSFFCTKWAEKWQKRDAGRAILVEKRKNGNLRSGIWRRYAERKRGKEGIYFAQKK